MKGWLTVLHWSRFRFIGLLLGILLLTGAVDRQALAQSAGDGTVDVVKCIELARQQYAQGQYEDAAKTLISVENRLFNEDRAKAEHLIGVALCKAHHWWQSYYWFTTALRLSKDAKFQRQIRDSRSQCLREQELAQAKPPELSYAMGVSPAGVTTAMIISKIEFLATEEEFLQCDLGIRWPLLFPKLPQETAKGLSGLPVEDLDRRFAGDAVVVRSGGVTLISFLGLTTTKAKELVQSLDSWIGRFATLLGWAEPTAQLTLLFVSEERREWLRTEFHIQDKLNPAAPFLLLPEDGILVYLAPSLEPPSLDKTLGESNVPQESSPAVAGPSPEELLPRFFILSASRHLPKVPHWLLFGTTTWLAAGGFLKLEQPETFFPSELAHFFVGTDAVPLATTATVTSMNRDQFEGPLTPDGEVHPQLPLLLREFLLEWYSLSYPQALNRLTAYLTVCYLAEHRVLKEAWKVASKPGEASARGFDFKAILPKGEESFDQMLKEWMGVHGKLKMRPLLDAR